MNVFDIMLVTKIGEAVEFSDGSIAARWLNAEYPWTSTWETRNRLEDYIKEHQGYLRFKYTTDPEFRNWLTGVDMCLPEGVTRNRFERLGFSWAEAFISGVSPERAIFLAEEMERIAWK